MAKSIYGAENEKLRGLFAGIPAGLEAGMTQDGLARKLGLPQSFVSKYESGERRLDIVELWRVCKVLQVPLRDLIESWESLLK